MMSIVRIDLAAAAYHLCTLTVRGERNKVVRRGEREGKRESRYRE